MPPVQRGAVLRLFVQVPARLLQLLRQPPRYNLRVLPSPGRAHPSLPSQLNRDISIHCCNARSINHECMCSPGACYYQHHDSTVTNISISSALTMVTKQPIYVARAIHNTHNILRNLCYTCTDDLSHYTGNTYTLARIYIYRADPLVTMYA